MVAQTPPDTPSVHELECPLMLPRPILTAGCTCSPSVPFPLLFPALTDTRKTFFPELLVRSLFILPSNVNDLRVGHVGVFCGS